MRDRDVNEKVQQKKREAKRRASKDSTLTWRQPLSSSDGIQRASEDPACGHLDGTSKQSVCRLLGCH